MGERQRIAYIDLLKCTCIMFIMMYHIDHEFFNYLLPNLNNAVQAFHLPMFYFISGILFKLYGGFADFTRRKVSNILVPFVFFIVFAFVVRIIESGVRLALGAQGIELSWTELIEPFYLRYWPNTAPIWFLLSLFWVNIIFYALQRWVRPLWGLLLATMAISVVGYLLGSNKIELPLMLDTSFVALPYFVLGWGISRLGMVRPHRYDRWGVVCLLVVSIPIYFLSEFTNLHFQVLPSYWKLYCLPFVAILALFWACKPLSRIPVLCHYGRYSLIILGTHQVIFLPLRFLFIHYGMQPGVTLTLIVFALTMVIEWPLIWILRTYFPRFTAQEPFFKTGGWSI